MKARGVHLQYTFQAQEQRGATVQNPLFDLLQAVHEHGSIQRAASGLGASYRHVWGALKHWQDVLGEPLVSWTQGHPARLTPFAERLLWAETHARARLTPHIEALRAELERVLAEAIDGSQQVLTLYASHDLALPALRDAARDGERLHIDLRFAGSIDALRALAEGRCAVAGFHVPPLTEGAALFAQSLKPLLKPGRHKLIGCTRRTQGLVVAAGNPLGLHGLADVAAQRARFARRQDGSATWLLTAHLLAQARLDPVQLRAACTEDTHSAVAAAVAGGLADAGIAIEAAARGHGLGFVPLAEDDYYLVCLAEALEQPAVQALRRALHDAPWQQAVTALPGYALARPGEVLSLTRALPWWNFRRRK
ncbi:MAG: substrate-binding domain-containing protein [Gammaproteobacteria bacterium]